MIRLVDINGNVAASYRYDPYGKATSALGSHANINPLRYRGYVFDHETGLYYLQSRYYDPEIGRFINADAFASTGQGLLGNNMFAYCSNNPLRYTDSAGNIPCPAVVTAAIKDPGAYEYITDQNHEIYGSMILGGYTVSYNGCGAVASYDALISLGDPKPFDEVLRYYNGHWSRTFANGKFGILPWQVARFFKSLGYRTRTTSIPSFIDKYSKTADACIMFYVFNQETTFLGIEGTWPGAHFVEYSATDGGYIGRNTGDPTGTQFFSSPSEYGYDGSNYYVVCIFIYDDK